MPFMSITVEYAGPSKRNPKFGSVLDKNKIWYDTTLAIAGQLKKGQTVTVDAAQNERGFWRINSIAGPDQAQQGPLGVKSTITQVEGMFVMAVVGKAFEGTGTVPGRVEMAAMLTGLVMAWRDAEEDIARIAEQNEFTQAGDPGPDGAPPF